MDQRGKVGEVPADVPGGEGGRGGGQAQHAGELVSPHTPDVEVGDARTASLGQMSDYAAEFKCQGMVHLAVEQDAAAFAEQADSPPRYQHCAYQTHRGVQPRPAELQAAQQRHNSQHGGGRVGDDV